MKKRIMQAVAGAIGVAMAGASFAQSARADADWTDDVTALVIAPDQPGARQPSR